MQRRQFLLSLGASLAIAVPAFAESVVDQVIRQLVAQGYRDITVESTLLGRLRILANRKGGTREIILNPNTGEILRDLWTNADGESGSGPILDDVEDGDDGDDGGSGGDGGGSGGDDNGGSGGGSGGDDDDGDDDRGGRDGERDD